ASTAWPAKSLVRLARPRAAWRMPQGRPPAMSGGNEPRRRACGSSNIVSSVPSPRASANPFLVIAKTSCFASKWQLSMSCIRT
ncbi:unnamed protein product, partial [Symbiodinium necroappetens]